MLNTVADIKSVWPGDALNIDDTVQDGGGKTALDRFIEAVGESLARRLKKWVGAEAYTEAATAAPAANPDRADALRDAEMHLFHAAMVEHLVRVNSAGMEKDITLPSGTRISLSVFSRVDYEKTILMFSDAAYCSVAEWIL